MKFSKSKDNTPTSSRESSLNRLPLDLLNDNGNPNPNTNTADINSDYSFPNDVNVQGTSDHPLGDTILDTMTHSKAKATSEDIINMSKKFMKYLELNDAEMNSQQSQTLQLMDEKIYQNHLKDHTSTQEVKEPQNFSPHDRLTHDNTSKHNNLLTLVRSAFPKKKFSGNDANYTVIEYLEGMNQGQKLCCLSESEFKDMLLQTTTGTVYDTMRSYLSLKMPIRDIYNWLLSVYHQPQSPDLALNKLLNFNIPKFKKLADATSEVLQLAIRASFLTPEKNRKDIVDNYAAQFLLKSLPHDSQQLGRKLYQDMCVHNNGEAPSFVHFTKALCRYAPTINKDINRNGQHPDNSRQRQNTNRQFAIKNINAKNQINNKKDNDNNYQKQSYSSRLINNNKRYNNTNTSTYSKRSNEPFSINNSYKQNAKSNFNNSSYNQRYNNNNNASIPNYKPNINYNSNKPKINEIRLFSKNKDKPNYKQMNDSTYKNMQKNPNKIPMKQYCTLCGSSTHNASDICYKMRNENNEIVPVPPSFAPCEICLKLSKTLYHPPEFCFNKNKTTNNYKPNNNNHKNNNYKTNSYNNNNNNKRNNYQNNRAQQGYNKQ